MKKMKLMVLMLALALVAAAALAAAAADPKAQTTCPVMGGKINQDLYVDYQGRRIYFCCPACVELFKKEPDKYLKKLEEQGVTPEKTPKGK